MIEPLIVLALQWFLATLLIVEGARKLAPGNSFRAVVASYGMVPRPLLPLAATLLPVAEIVAGLMMAMSIAVPVAVLILLSYLFVIMRSISSGLSVADCGCSFGKQASPLSQWHVVRAVVLVAVSALARKGGREYLSRVPGAAMSNISDKDLADVLNWMIQRFDPNHIPQGFRPYSAIEVGRLRKNPIISNAQNERRRILERAVSTVK